MLSGFGSNNECSSFKDVLNLLKNNHHSFEQLPTFFLDLALVQIVRHHFELRCQKPKLLNSVGHGEVKIPRVSG